jgi:spore coat polysaccharide biosynthesis protein SpsF
MKVIGIIQARMGSTRFPRKIFEVICGSTLLEHYYNRVEFSKQIHKIIIATTTNPLDDEIYDFCISKNISVYRGSENNVIKRFYDCAKSENADIVVRLTPDDPFVDPDVIDKAVQILLKNLENIDFVTNHFKPTYPEGLDIEVYPIETLGWINKRTDKKYQKEHVFPYIQEHTEEVRTINFQQEQDYSYLRWTIDYPVDLLMVKAIYYRLYKQGKIFKQQDIINLIKENPSISMINSLIKRKEGVNKSIEMELNNE